MKSRTPAPNGETRLTPLANVSLPMLFIGAGVAGWLAVRLWRTWHAFNFENKVVLITGGSRGLGLVLARELARERARIVICARDNDELERAADDLICRGAHLLAVRCDVTDREQVERMIRFVIERRGPIDVLINNAGTISVGPVETMTLDDYRHAMDTNFWAALYTTLTVLPEMRKRQQGRIVNITSIGGKVSVPHLLPYSAGKFALVGLSHGLRAELAKDGIVVTTVCPGLMRTGSPRNAKFKGQHRAEFAWFSISDALPFFSMSAERAARQTLGGCRRGDAEVVLSLPAQCAVLFHGLFPGLTADVLSVVHRMLPAAGGIGKEYAYGKESESPLAPSLLTTLSDQAAFRNNEVAPGDATEAEESISQSIQ